MKWGLEFNKEIGCSRQIKSRHYYLLKLAWPLRGNLLFLLIFSVKPYCECDFAVSFHKGSGCLLSFVLGPVMQKFVVLWIHLFNRHLVNNRTNVLHALIQNCCKACVSILKPIFHTPKVFDRRRLFFNKSSSQSCIHFLHHYIGITI